MPELPEVETVCEGLRQNVLNHEIANVVLNRKNLRIPFPEKLAEKLCGKKITRVNRRAKYILILFDDGQCLAIHLGMSGRITIFGKHEDYEPQKHDHMILEFTIGYRVVLNDARRFGMVFLLSYDQLDTHKAFAHLGPEPLGNDFSAPVLKQALKPKASAIKIAIMDQRVVVGVGNIYACEALYRSGINPTEKANRVSSAKTEILVSNIRAVLSEAIKAGGSSLKDHQKTDGTLGYFQHNFSVYDREGQACPDCDCNLKKTGGIKRIVQGGRSTFYCEVKQR